MRLNTSVSYLFIQVLVVLLASLSTLSGCNFAKHQSVQDVEESQNGQSDRTPRTYEFRGGVLGVYVDSPCSFVFKRSGQPDFAREVSSALSGHVVYVRDKQSRETRGPDAIIEWTYPGDYHYSLIFSADSRDKIANVIATAGEHLAFETDAAGAVQKLEFNCIFPEFGGARQVILPLKFVWSKNKFVLDKPPHLKNLSEAELRQKIEDYRALFAHSSEGDLPAELAEDVLRLSYAGDKKDAKILLHRCFPADRSDERKRWSSLQQALTEKLQTFNRKQF